jgi:glutamate racemase
VSIGFFDSGVGGLTIWREVVKELPLESTVYLADSVNAPYGEKSVEEIIALSIANTQKLIELGAALVVVACNTATTQAISALREKFDIPFVGIEPAIKPAAQSSVSKYIGVLATNGTIESDHFNKTKDNYSEEAEVITQVGEGLVKLIESGKINSLEMDSLLTKHLNKLTKFPIDRLVLGCTHYPLLIPKIKKIIASNITIVDTGIAVAHQVKRMLLENDLEVSSEQPSHKLFTTGSLTVLKSISEDELNTKGLIMSYSSLYQSE